MSNVAPTRDTTHATTAGYTKCLQRDEEGLAPLEMANE
jgi:hypothetical protein